VLGSITKQGSKQVPGGLGRISLAATYTGDGNWALKAELKPRARLRSASVCVGLPGGERPCKKARGLRRKLRFSRTARAGRRLDSVAVRAGAQPRSGRKTSAKVSLSLP
jgi:hypothetical protein